MQKLHSDFAFLYQMAKIAIWLFVERANNWLFAKVQSLHFGNSQIRSQ